MVPALKTTIPLPVAVRLVAELQAQSTTPIGSADN